MKKTNSIVLMAISIMVLSIIPQLGWGQSTEIFNNDCSDLPEGWTNQGMQKSGYYLIDDNQYVISPVFDLSAYSTLTLTSNLRSYGNGTAPECTIEISLDGGTTWSGGSEVVSDIPNDYTDYPWHINALGSTTVVFRWSKTAGTRNLRINTLTLSGTQSGGNATPVITNISQNPISVTASDAVSISADVTDDNTVSTVVLQWGTVSGALTNSVNMTVSSGSTYVGTISAQAEGTSVYYAITATDNESASTTSAEISYTVNQGEPTNHVANFAAVADSYNKITLTWLDNDGAQAADGFLIVGKDAAGTYTQLVDGTDIADDLDWTDNNFNVKVAHGVQTYAVEGLIAAQTYSFTIYPYTNSGADIDYKTDATVPNVTTTTQDAPALPNLIISEIADPFDVYQARYVEIYNPTDMPVDLTDVYLQKQSNGGTTFSGKDLTGSISPKGKYICANNEDDFNTAYGFYPNIYSGSISGNGDDAYILRYGGAEGVIIDIYGVLNQEGTGEPWEYEDCQVVRKLTVTEGTATWSADEWVIIPTATTAVMTPAEHAENKVWTGATDANWNTKSNWEAINTRQFLPDASSNITISTSATNALVIDDNRIIYNDLKAEAAEKLEVNPTKCLEVLGNLESDNPANLILKADATGSAVLLHSTDNVQATVQVHYADLDMWYYVGSPISNATSNTYLGDYLYSWDEAAATWVNILSTTEPLNVTQGYAMKKQTNNMVAYAGVLNNGNISSVNITNAGASGNQNQDGWNLLSNPYPSVIDVLEFVYPNGVTAGVSVFNHNNQSYIAYSEGGGGNEEARYIQPGQAFLIKSTAQAAQTLSFTNASRTAANVAPMDKAIQESLKLSLHKHNAQMDETYISFREGATVGYDTYYDMYKMESPHTHLFSYLPDTTAGKLAINSIPNAQALDFIPLGIAVEAGAYTIQAAQIDSFNENDNFYLLDKQAGKYINLRESSTYAFEVMPGDYMNRFDIAFSMPQGVADAIANEQAFYTFSRVNNVFVMAATQPSTTEVAVVVYDVLGQVVYQNEHYTLGEPIALGAQQTYVVNILTKEGSSSQHKVIVK